MHFENINQAKKELVEAILSEYISVLIDDDRVQEIKIKKAYKIQYYIEENFDLKEMKDLLSHDIARVRVWAAKMLLPIYEEIALKVLDDISKSKIPHCSSGARIIYCEWKNEPISFD